MGLVCWGTSATAQLRLPAIIGEHMVLQRSANAFLWGWDTPGRTVRVTASWAAAASETVVDSSGRWEVELLTSAEPGPHVVVIEGSSRVQLDDVLLGEVWLASGQSNMEWALSDSQGGTGFVVDADFPQMRFFDVEHGISRDIGTACGGRWQVVAPESVGSFSAVAYHFGRELHTELDVAVGLIGSNWGGTVAESWTSAEGLRGLGDFDDALARIEGELQDPEAAEAQAGADLEAWWQKLENVQLRTTLEEGENSLPDEQVLAPEQGGGWYSEQPGPWHEHGLETFDGVVSMEREVQIPAEWAGQALQLELGAIDDMDTTTYASASVGGIEAMGGWTTPRVYEVPGHLVQAGPVQIGVRVVDTGGPGGFMGPASAMRLGLLGGDPQDALSLAGPWWLNRGASMDKLGPVPSSTGWFHQNSPTALFNGMIAPLLPYAIRGAIFYQGESNVGRAEQYARLFPALIESWRQAWSNPELPFYFVQLAPFAYRGEGQLSARLRDAQRLSAAAAHTGMVVTLDIGNPSDIHPLNKHDVGHRLALWALAQTYGVDGLEFSGPSYRSMRIAEATLVLSFDHAEGLHGVNGAPSHFEIGADDEVFYPAKAVIVGQTVVLSSPLVAAPTMARFAWSDVAEPNLFNGAGLPASSFQTQWNHR
ncbi:MAG: sialate O-acetylesterase [Pseudohongiellaceae bacterium]|jgi:sialate O-acetylesterase